ncbi:ImmA/IrrE family metallo-endopeptidase [Methanosphaera sp. WGK6]|uniref:ImmA/IrrE family metallo-endopeptidase n=1 Tax=Methanosphaera sp. WGK6 TaxID=1561964 RepID=UPI000869D609|nr:ImmA/IrrE family metallo-endopeptidase [Methanosphaera sp. WGK6]OED29893.1 hypothetical protein NL43_05630 [Methanosphaera sp. WGK6]
MNKYPKYYLELDEEAKKCREMWDVSVDDSIDLFAVVLGKIKDLTIIFLNFDNDFSGCCHESENNQKIIFINKNHSYGRQRFTLAHELYHLLVEKNGDYPNKSSEKNANIFASCLLLPHTALRKYEEKEIKGWNMENIIKAEQYFQISHSAFLKRLLLLKKINKTEYNTLQYNVKRKAMELGYPTKLYDESYENNEVVLGNYLKLVKKLEDYGLISHGKKEEILMDAFYDNLVFDQEEVSID